MFDKTKKNVEFEVEKYAKRNIISKLKKQGIDYQQLDDNEFGLNEKFGRELSRHKRIPY